jgi:hypothetical protein
MKPRDLLAAPARPRYLHAPRASRRRRNASRRWPRPSRRCGHCPAAAIGIAFPADFVLRADKVID